MSNELRWLWQNERRTGAYRDSNHSTRADMTALKMLVVDDSPVHRLLLAGLLNALFPGSIVDKADDGAQAQSMLRAQRYDIVLSDWIMSGMDGLQLANWLSSGEVPHLPFVLCSTHDGVDEITALFSTHGIDGYLVKPFDQAAIKEVVLVAAKASAPAA